MLLESLIPALLPAATDGIRALINRFTGGSGAKPANVDEVVTLMTAETKRMEALAKIDQAGNVSQWVANVRALQRPGAAFFIIAGYVGVVAAGSDDAIVAQMANYAQMVTFYLFGDRTYMYFKRGS